MKITDMTTEIIVASIRNPIHVLDAALIGADIATIPYNVMEQLIKHPLTDIGLERFLADWKKIGQIMVFFRIHTLASIGILIALSAGTASADIYQV